MYLHHFFPEFHLPCNWAQDSFYITHGGLRNRLSWGNLQALDRKKKKRSLCPLPTCHCPHERWDRASRVQRLYWGRIYYSKYSSLPPSDPGPAGVFPLSGRREPFSLERWVPVLPLPLVSSSPKQLSELQGHTSVCLVSGTGRALVDWTDNTCSQGA